MTNLQLKEVAKEATNKDFYNSFATSSKVTTIIGYFGQLVSALTEFHFIFSAFGGVYDSNFTLKNILAFCGGLIGIYIFEVLGVRVYLVRIIRQIVNKDFGGSERKVLFGFNLLFVLALCGANLLTSFLGQKYSFATVTNVTTTDKTFKLDEDKNAKISSLTARYDVKLNNLKTDYTKEVKIVTAYYDSDIKELKNSRWTHRENKTKYDSYTLKIDKKLASKETDLSDLKTQFNSCKQSLKKSFTADKKTLSDSFDNRISDVSKTEISKVNLWSTVQKYTLPILLLFILLSWFAIVYNEIFLKGSGQKIEVVEVEKRPILLVEFLTGFYDKIYQMFYWITAKFLGSTKYEFKAIKQETNIYQLKHSATENQSQIAAKVVRKIGYQYNGSDNQNDNQNNIKNGLGNSYQNGSVTDFDVQNKVSPGYSLNVERNTNDLSEANKQNNVNVDTKQKQCKNCKKTFQYKHWNAQYCGDVCRIESWEKRTGKKFKKPSKK